MGGIFKGPIEFDSISDVPGQDSLWYQEYAIPRIETVSVYHRLKPDGKKPYVSGLALNYRIDPNSPMKILTPLYIGSQFDVDENIIDVVTLEPGEYITDVKGK